MKISCYQRQVSYKSSRWPGETTKTDWECSLKNFTSYLQGRNSKIEVLVNQNIKGGFFYWSSKKFNNTYLLFWFQFCCLTLPMWPMFTKMIRMFTNMITIFINMITIFTSITIWSAGRRSWLNQTMPWPQFHWSIGWSSLIIMSDNDDHNSW